MPARTPTKLSRVPAHRLRQLSVAAGVDPRTVRKLLAGGSVFPLTRERIEAAIRSLGLETLLPHSTAGGSR